MRSPPSAARSFDLVRHHRANGSIFLYALDLIEVNGDDLRHDPLEGRKATLEMILAKSGPGIQFNEAHFRAAQSSPPHPLWFCIADMDSRSSKGLSRHTIPCDRVRVSHPSSDNPPVCDRF
jgi:hypothetical protein